MRVLGLAFAVLLSGTASIVAHANGVRSNMAPVTAGPAPDIVLAWDGGSSGGHPGAIGGERTAAHPRPMERPVGATTLGAKPLLWRVGSLWRAGCPDLLGLRSRERCL
jgi:hypothetical protein